MVSLFLTVWQIYLYIKLRTGQVNSVLLCEVCSFVESHAFLVHSHTMFYDGACYTFRFHQKINAVIGVYFTVHFIMTVMLMVSGHWGLFFLNAPLVVLRLYQMVVQVYLSSFEDQLSCVSHRLPNI